MADVNEGTTEGGEDTSVTVDAVALTPEQRDEQTVARLLGTEPAADAAATATPAAGEADESDSDAGDEADGGDAGDAEDEDLPEVTDEDVELILDGLEDRLLAHPRLQKVLEDRAKADADRRYEERRRAESVSQESERLIEQGRGAVKNIHDLFTKLDTVRASAIKGEDVDESVKFSADELMTELGAFGAAAVAEARRDSDNAFADAFRAGAELGGPLTDEEKESVIKAVQTAQRIANDPKQGRGASLQHLFAENVKFLVERAKKAGKAEAEAEFTRKREAQKKLIGETGTRAAVAKLANSRKNLPAKPSATPAEATQPRANLEAYRAAKAAGDHEKADAIMAEMAQAR